MKEILLQMKKMLAGKWTGEGFAKYPTINDTAYTEELEFIADEYKDVIFFRQKHGIKMILKKMATLFFGIQVLLF